MTSNPWSWKIGTWKFAARSWLPLVVLGVVGVALRVMAARGDLWLDEIMSVVAVRNLSAVTDVFSLHHDNNHLLTSAWLFLIGGVDHPILTRGLSLLSGVGSLVLLVTWPIDRGGSSEGAVVQHRERLIRLFLFASSYVMVLYDSEARGYAQLVFGALLAWRALHRFHAAPSLLSGLVYWVGAAVCVLGHVAGVQWIATLVVWSCASTLLLPEKTQFSVSRLLLLHGPVAIGLLWLWVSFISLLPPGSGDIRPWYEVLINTLSISFGGPLLSQARPDISLVAVFCAFVILVGLLRALWSVARSDRVFFFTMSAGLVVFPAAALVVLEPRVLYERYFISSIALAYFLLARVIAVQWDSGKARRWIMVLLLAVIAFSQALNVAQLLHVHRGSYSYLAQWLASVDSSASATVSVDQQFRWKTVLEYFWRVSEGAAPLLVTDRDATGTEVSWHVRHSQDAFWVDSIDALSGDRISGHSFHRVMCRPSAPLSGWAWCLYQSKTESGGVLGGGD